MSAPRVADAARKRLKAKAGSAFTVTVMKRKRAKRSK
jgi:hypothetical protein